MNKLIDIILHVDKYLIQIVQQYSTLTYGLLFLIIFLETGVVIAPFLPGDSLLFAVGALSATGALDIYFSFLIIFIAAVLGDTVNYHIGKYIGPRVFKSKNSFLFHQEHLILARFIPIIRTFAPFVAGIGRMSYKRFLAYNVIGGLLWTGFFIFLGYLFGNISFVKENFSLVVIAIIIISFIPVIKEVYWHYWKKN